MAKLPFVFAAAFAGSLWAATAQAKTLIIGNNTTGIDGPINTYNFDHGTLLHSFVPTGASSGNGRGLLVFGSKVYYTELGCCGTDAIHVAPFNGGAGGPDSGTLPNPAGSTVFIQDLDAAKGVLYAMTGYFHTGPLSVYGLNPVTGVVVKGPVAIDPSVTTTQSDGFTVLPNGNFLINRHDASCTYKSHHRFGDRRHNDYAAAHFLYRSNLRQKVLILFN